MDYVESIGRYILRETEVPIKDKDCGGLIYQALERTVLPPPPAAGLAMESEWG